MKASSLWKTLTQTQRRAWNAWAKNNRMLLDDGNVRRVSGRKAMTMVLRNRTAAGQALDPSIVPAAFASTYPALKLLDVMHLGTSESAILSAVIFNALVILLLVPLALKGVAYKPLGAAFILKRNLLIYGFGGLVVPFVGIKAIDLVLDLLGVFV